MRLDVADQEYTIDITNPVVRVTAPIEIAKVFDDGGYPGVVDPGMGLRRHVVVHLQRRRADGSRRWHLVGGRLLDG